MVDRCYRSSERALVVLVNDDSGEIFDWNPHTDLVAFYLGLRLHDDTSDRVDWTDLTPYYVADYVEECDPDGDVTCAYVEAWDIPSPEWLATLECAIVGMSGVFS